MKKTRLGRIDNHLKEELKNRKFRKAFEIERAKVALAQRIAEIRQDKHLTQAALAKKLGTSQQFISQVETGQEKNLTIETLLKIAHSLGKGVTISFTRSCNKAAFLKVA